MAIFTLLAATAAATAPLPSAEDKALFAAFKAPCSQVRKLDRVAKAARKAQWQEVAEDAHPNLASLVRGGREALLKDEPDAKVYGTQFRKDVGGRTLWLVASRYEDKSGYWGNGCRVYDFAAAAPLPLETLVALMGKPNTGTVPLPDGNARHLWEPGWKSGHSVEVSYLTGTDPVSQKFGLKGLVLTAQAIGGF
ncbi:hypothetical protein [Novosphingobium sp.]|uniref:hypothetical protein n=1 Tax=Novosphingobium sp. TaxID=1874826 RepID=UPI0027339558|nr:hypothetical protein [Novosphingobium sp.]MDP3907437.1 hypothetical protein [Novosphingobium sp.]